MKRLTLATFLLSFFLVGASYAQHPVQWVPVIVGWTIREGGRRVPIVRMVPSRNLPARLTPNAQQPWSARQRWRQRPSSPTPTARQPWNASQRWGRRPTSLPAQARRFAWRLATEQANIQWEMRKRQIEQAYQERQNAQLRYGAALRREWEAHRRASYAQWRNPYSSEARSLR
jgi:hypothetical protein